MVLACSALLALKELHMASSLHKSELLLIAWEPRSSGSELLLIA